MNGNGSAWADNPNPQPRTFNAELRTGGVVVATSNYVTVEVRKFVWNVTSVTASPQVQVVPGSVSFTATVDRTVFGTGYQIYIYRDGASSTNERCSSGTQCTTSVSRSWLDNPSPKAGHVRVEVRGPGGDLASNSAELQAPFRRFIFPVSLSFSSETDANGNVLRKATATTNRNVYGTGYQLKIKRNDGVAVCSSSSGVQCGPTAVTVGQTYRAVVDNGTHVAGQSAAFTVTDGGPQLAAVGDVDLATLAALVAGAGAGYDVCTRLGLSPYKTNVVGRTTSGGDQWEICVAAAGAGAGTLAILTEIAESVGGEANLWWLFADLLKESPDSETPPSPDDAKAPRPLPPPPLPDVDKLADTLVAQGAGVALAMAAPQP